jgi:hypothetical protein
MRLTIEFFWQREGERAVTQFLKPLTLDFPMVELAREAARKVADRDGVPIHSFTIKSEDGTISERWFQMNGSWRRKDD